MVKFCDLLRTSSSKTQMLFLKMNLFQEYWLFCNRFITFTFGLCGLLSVIHKQQVKQYNYYIDQSELLTRLQTDFTPSVWNFCRWVADISLGKTSLAVRNKEKQLYSQATSGSARAQLWTSCSLTSVVKDLSSGLLGTNPASSQGLTWTWDFCTLSQAASFYVHRILNHCLIHQGIQIFKYSGSSIQDLVPL